MTRTARGLLLFIFLVMLSLTFSAVLIPLAAKDSGLGAQMSGLLVGVPAGVGLFTDMPFAAWSDVVGRRRPLLVGAGMGVAAAVVVSVVSGSLVLGAATFVLGACFSMSQPSALAFLTEATADEHHANIQGLNGSVQGLAALVGTTGGVLLATSWGPRHSFWVVSGTLALAVLLAARLRDRRRPPAGRPWGLRELGHRLVRVGRLMQEEPGLRFAACISILNQFQLIVVENSFLPLYLIDFKHYSGLVVGGYLAVRTLVAVTLSAVFGPLFRRVGLVVPVLIGNLLGIVGILLVGVLDNPIGLIGPFVLQGAGIAFGPAGSNMLITSATSEDERAIGFSATTFVTRIGTFTLPVVIGFAVQAGGYRWLFLPVAIVGVVLLAAMGALARSVLASERPKPGAAAL